MAYSPSQAELSWANQQGYRWLPAGSPIPTGGSTGTGLWISPDGYDTLDWHVVHNIVNPESKPLGNFTPQEQAWVDAKEALKGIQAFDSYGDGYGGWTAGGEQAVQAGHNSKLYRISDLNRILPNWQSLTAGNGEQADPWTFRGAAPRPSEFSDLSMLSMFVPAIAGMSGIGAGMAAGADSATALGFDPVTMGEAAGNFTSTYAPEAASSLGGVFGNTTPNLSGGIADMAANAAAGGAPLSTGVGGSIADMAAGAAGAGAAGATTGTGWLDTLMSGNVTNLGNSATTIGGQTLSQWLNSGGLQQALGLGTGGGSVASTAANGTALSRVIGGNGTTADYLSILGNLGAAGLGMYGSSQQADAFRDLANQSRQDRLPYLNASLGYLNNPQSFYDGPGKQALDANLRALSAQFGNPISSPTALGIATDAGMKNWLGSVTGLGNLGLSGEDTRAQLGSNAIQSNAGIYNSIGSALADITNPKKTQFNFGGMKFSLV